ncbi:MAG: SapC family protein [Halochromatium sp.]
MSRYLPLSPQRFSELRWQRFRDYRHTLGVNLTPVAAPEVSAAAAHLPLAFASDAQGQRQLCALTGLRKGVNHCLDARHAWLAGYTPALLRGHPFRLLAPPGQGESSQRVLCVDVESPWVGPDGSEAFLDGERMTPAVAEIFQFLGQLAQHLARTEQAVAALEAATLLVPWTIEDEHGEPLRGLLRVDEAKLAEVAPEMLAELHRQGALALAYAQMISTHRLPALQARARQLEGQKPRQDLSDFFVEQSDLQFDFDQ